LQRKTSGFKPEVFYFWRPNAMFLREFAEPGQSYARRSCDIQAVERSGHGDTRRLQLCEQARRQSFPFCSKQECLSIELGRIINAERG
jgi:hypothetical protein